MTIVDASLGSPIYSVGILVNGKMMELPLDCGVELDEFDVKGKMVEVFIEESLEYPKAWFCVDRSVEYTLPAKIQGDDGRLINENIKVYIVQARHLWNNGDYSIQYPFKLPSVVNIDL